MFYDQDIRDAETDAAQHSDPSWDAPDYGDFHDEDDDESDGEQ